MRPQEMNQEAGPQAPKLQNLTSLNPAASELFDQSMILKTAKDSDFMLYDQYDNVVLESE